MENIRALQRKSEAFLRLFLLAHIPATALFCWAMGVGVLAPTISAAAIALVGAGASLALKESAAGRIALGVALMALTATLVYALTGHPWQIDMHMYFFAGLAILAALIDWRVIVAATVTVAVHHLGLNFLLPAAVFPDGADFFRVVLHAVIVVFEAGVLIWLLATIAQAAERSDAASAEARAAQAAREEEERNRIAAEAEARERAAREAEAARKKALADLAQAFEESVGRVVAGVAESVAELDRTAKVLAQATDSATRSSSDAAGGVDEAAQAIAAVASATEELAAAIEEISAQVQDSSSIARNAADESAGAGETVEGVAAAASEIETVLNLINDIAEQTNLLALNATIEAARAGEAGKGFAVVANEVKSLAEQTGKATEETSGKIKAMQGRSQKAVEAMRNISGTIGRLNDIAASIAAAVEQQTAATREISSNVSRTERSTSAAAGSMQSVRSGAEEAGRVSDVVRQAAESLSERTKSLNEEVARFVATVRQGG